MEPMPGSGLCRPHLTVKGARPADLPVDQASRFELVINVAATKGLGITVPTALLARADEVID